MNPRDAEKTILTALKLPKEIKMRHRLPHFAHIFSGEGYSAGYYSYLWADVLRHDAFKAFMESKGGPYDKKVAKKFQEKVRNNYDLLKDPAWKVIDTNDKSLEQVYTELSGLVKQTIQTGAKQDSIQPLWPLS